MKNLILTAATTLVFAGCNGTANQEASSADVDIIGDPYDEYYEANAEAHEQVLGFVAIPRYESDENLTAEYDENDDQTLDEQEQENALISIRERREQLIAEKEEELKQLADLNQDGEITLDEVKELIRTKRQEFRERLTAASAELRRINGEMASELKEICSANREEKARGKPVEEAVEPSEEQLEAEMSECAAAKEAAKVEFFEAITAKRELVKNMIAEIQAIIQVIKQNLGDEGQEEADAIAEEAGPGAEKGKGKGKDKKAEQAG